MQSLINTETFKTQRCKKLPSQHKLLDSPFYFSCSDYHSKEDKRRNPFNAQKTSLTYSSQYIEDYFSPDACCNMIQYLFHPHIYKNQTCNDSLKLIKSAENVKCTKIFCPFLHQGQNKTQIVSKYSNLSASVFPYRAFKKQFVQDLHKLRTGDIDNFKEQINKRKLILQQQLKTIKETQQAESQRINKEALQKAQIKQKKPENNEFIYTKYEYFQYGERIPIIEDRHHEFKNYKDIIKNSITHIVMKYIAAFLNSEGGVLYIGIDDSSVVYGLKLTQHQFDKFLLDIDNEGKFHMMPPLMPQKYQIRLIPVMKNGQTGRLWIIQIKVPQMKIHNKNRSLTTYKRECFMRMNASTHCLDALDLLQYMKFNQNHQQNTIEQSFESLEKSIQKEKGGKSIEQIETLKSKLIKLSQKLQADKRKKSEGVI